MSSYSESNMTIKCCIYLKTHDSLGMQACQPSYCFVAPAACITFNLCLSRIRCKEENTDRSIRLCLCFRAWRSVTSFFWESESQFLSMPHTNKSLLLILSIFISFIFSCFMLFTTLGGPSVYEVHASSYFFHPKT